MRDLLIYAFLAVPLIGAFSMFAVGVSVIYRASRVLNLSHGAMALVPAYVNYTLHKAGLPVGGALIVSVLLGAALGVVVERLFVTRLRPQGPTAQTVGTVAVAGLLIAVTAKLWGTSSLLAPQIFPEGEIHVAGTAIRYGDLGLFVVGLVLSAGLFAFFRFTEYGLAMRAAAQNRQAASLMGIDPDLAAAVAWALGGGLAAIAGILLAAVTNLDPYNLPLQVLPAFVAALIGGLGSLTGAMLGSVIAGLLFGFVPLFASLPLVGSLFSSSGATQLVLALLAMVVMATRGRRLSGAEEGGAGLKVQTSLRRARVRPGVKIAAVCALVAWPFLVPFSVLGTSLLAIELAVVAISLVVLIGWVGQISLAQASFVGIGALTTGLVTRGFELGFPLNLVAGAAGAALAAVILGMVALRVRGLYLAVATLIFAWMADQFLFPSQWLGAGSGTSTIPNQRIGVEGGFPSLDLTSRKTLYLLMIAVLVLIMAALANLRDTKTGRAFFAIRGSETAAAALGVDVVHYKLLAFALSGALAGIGGALLMVEQRTVAPSQFFFTVSLQYLAVAVVGGLGSLGGAVAAGGLFAMLNELFFRVPALAGWLEVVSASLLAFVLLVQPGGLAAIAQSVREGRGPVALALLRAGRLAEEALRRVWKEVRRAKVIVPAPNEDWFSSMMEHVRDRAQDRDRVATNGEAKTEAEPEPKEAEPLRLTDVSALPGEIPADREQRQALLEASEVTVRFGGLTAVAEASLSVKEREIVGLIGPNGAGKTTLFNSILGLNSPAQGQVTLYGKGATSFPPHLRARLGVARTFQVLQLFNELSVFDNLLVATHLRDSTGVFSNLAAAPGTVTAEREARERVTTILELLNLQDVEQEQAASLPFGTLRMVELGRALVTGARLLLLDEIASGLNEAETDRLSDVISGVRSLGVSILLIEHDIRMVTGISDHVYVLNQGRMIADGSPDDIKRNSEVIAAYLGESDAPSDIDSETVEVPVDA
jgi:ABC-type branched-subunit amino acid transport system ATPase component/branched-subunit amino acid ABC-type transport system permease component